MNYPCTGTITSIDDQGTIVIATLNNGARIFFDHRMFQHFWDGEGGNIIGRAIDYDGEGLSFLD